MNIQWTSNYVYSRVRETEAWEVRDCLSGNSWWGKWQKIQRWSGGKKKKVTKWKKVNKVIVPFAKENGHMKDYVKFKN